MPLLTPTIAETDLGAGPTMARTIGEVTRYLRWVNYLGVPALALPCGFDSRALPIGMQLVGRPFSETTLFRLGNAYQAETQWHRRVPDSL
jgi:aspartyl-tRNA(Asn)/glutamyl-tRNA(Gln) amidotransferase subunit A